MVQRKNQAGGRGSGALVPGYNHNVKHRGRIFHIQTEDSGPKNPVIITHLFVGGTILATDRLSYEDLVGAEGYEATVRERMKEQHKVMLRKLVHGTLDRLLGFGEPAEPTVEETPPPGMEAPPPAASAAPTTSPFVPAPTSATARPAAPGTAAWGPRQPVAPPPPRVPGPGLASASPRPAAAAPPTSPSAAGGALGRTMPFVSRDAVASPVIVVGVEPPPAGQAPHYPGAPVAGAPRPPALFGDSLVSDKSLDDVILQYLAEEFMAKDQK